MRIVARGHKSSARSHDRAGDKRSRHVTEIDIEGRKIGGKCAARKQPTTTLPLLPMLDYCFAFGSAARWARLAIQASYSGVPLLGGNPWGSPPNHVGNVSAAVSPIVRLPVAHDISGKHGPKRISLRISFTMAELYTLRFQSPHCRTTFVAALHSLTVMIPQRRIDGPDRVRQCASLLGLAMVRGSQDHRLSSRRSHACCVGEALPILIIYALLNPDLWGAKPATNS